MAQLNQLDEPYLGYYPHAELVFAVVCPLGTEHRLPVASLKNYLGQFGYATNHIQISDLFQSLLEKLGDKWEPPGDKSGLASYKINGGNRIRRLTEQKDVLARVAAGLIAARRFELDAYSPSDSPQPMEKTAQIITTLKRPEEVTTLRKIYGSGFFLIGLSATKAHRTQYFKERGMEDFASGLIETDAAESDEFGQQMRETFHLADVFVPMETYSTELGRFLDLVFGSPSLTPTSDEHAMFMAYAASLKSGDLARQVGAAVIDKDGDLLSVGYNEAPKPNGGLYGPEAGTDRDIERKHDSNDIEKEKMILQVLKAFGCEDMPMSDARTLLKPTGLTDITEFGRSVHAEMEALLACARRGSSVRGATLYATTLPCHNCCRHIIASGIKKVVYIAGVSPEEEQGLVEPYKEGLSSEWNIRKYNLDELYVRFLRLAERRIAEMTGRGIVCYISSYSYLSDPSFVVVRKRFCGEFDYAWIDCLNGDSRETGKLTPSGQPDPSVFSTEYNREGIRLGTAVGLFAKTGAANPQALVRYRDFWGADKRALLLKTLDEEGDFDAQYEEVEPAADNRFSFRPSKTKANYAEWPMVVELAEEEPISGLQEMRRGALMAHEREALEDRMKTYFDTGVDWATFSAEGTALSKKAGRFDPVSTRNRLQNSEAYDSARLKRYALYPFDDRWCYYSSVRPLWNEPRPELIAQRADEESFLIVRRFAERPKEGRPAFFTSALPDYHLLRPNAVAIPLRLGSAPAEVSPQTTGQGSIFEHFQDSKHTSANLSQGARAYLAALTKLKPDQNEELSRAIWLHSLAILYAPLYLSEHATSVRADWPRIPLPDSLPALQHSAQLGAGVAQLLDVEKPVLGVTTGKLRKELNLLGRISGPKGLSLTISAGWGHAHKEKEIVMPGRGLEKKRDFTDEEKTAVGEGAAELGTSAEDVLTLWGDSALDIYLNNETFWGNVPESVWEYAIGGYQVLKKWLSYREREVLGRDIMKDEAREFTHIVRRIAALLLLEADLDKNYIAARAHFHVWQKHEAVPVTVPEPE